MRQPHLYFDVVDRPRVPRAAVRQRSCGASRNDLFASLDRPALKGLPSERYQYAEWKRCTVAPDYHVEVDDHYYSVPFGLLRETVEARFTDGTIEVFHKGERIASHPRPFGEEISGWNITRRNPSQRGELKNRGDHRWSRGA
jgi:hypothetical protein